MESVKLMTLQMSECNIAFSSNQSIILQPTVNNRQELNTSVYASLVTEQTNTSKGFSETKTL